MSAAKSYPPPPDASEVLRPKTLPLTEAHLERTKGLSAQRAQGRRESRAIVRAEMRRCRAVDLDLVDGLGVSARVVGRILAQSADDGAPAAPLDLGDLFPLARSGAGGARLALAIHEGIGEELRRIARGRDSG